MLETLLEQLASTEHVSVEGDVFHLAAVFGLPYRRDWRDDAWATYDAGDPEPLAEAAWEGLAKIFAARLRCDKVGDTPDAVPEMQRVASLIGFDLDAAKKEADKALPPPKAWGAGIDPHTLELPKAS